MFTLDVHFWTDKAPGSIQDCACRARDKHQQPMGDGTNRQTEDSWTAGHETSMRVLALEFRNRA
jgi:hypothetical protein